MIKLLLSLLKLEIILVCTLFSFAIVTTTSTPQRCIPTSTIEHYYPGLYTRFWGSGTFNSV